MRRAFSYIRFSSKIQELSDSKRRQIELTNKWLEAHPDVCLDTSLSLRDFGVSAFRGKNATVGALSVFLQAIKDKKIPIGSIFLCESLDRVSRADIASSLEIFLAIINGGVILVTLLDGKEYSKEHLNLTDLIISLTILSRANEESATKSRRIKEAWNNERSKIESGGKAKFRYPSWLKVVEVNGARTYQVIPERAMIIQSIFTMYINGKRVGAICKALNNSKIPFWGRKQVWDLSTVKHFLKNYSTIGEYRPGRIIEGKRTYNDGVISDYYPSIIDKEIFFKAQSILASAGTTKEFQKSDHIPNLFPAIAFCHCGEKLLYKTNYRNITLNGKVVERRKHEYLVCGGYRKGTCRENKAWQYKDFEKVFLSYCEELNADIVMNAEDSYSTDHQQIVDSLVYEIEDIDKKVSALVDAVIAAPKQAAAKLTERMETLETRKHELKKKLDKAKVNLHIATSGKHEISGKIQDIKNLLQALENSTGDALINIRSRLKLHLSNLISSVQVQISRKIISLIFKTNAILELHNVDGKWVGIYSNTDKTVLYDGDSRVIIPEDVFVLYR